jgi:hypothetical protein
MLPALLTLPLLPEGLPFLAASRVKAREPRHAGVMAAAGSAQDRSSLGRPQGLAAGLSCTAGAGDFGVRTSARRTEPAAAWRNGFARRGDMNSPVRIGLALNNLWTRGGLIYALPMR